MYPTFLRLPSVSEDLIHYHIIPYIPALDITPLMLRQHKYRLRFYNKIKDLCLLEHEDIRKDIMTHYNGTPDYTFDNDGYFLYIRYSVRSNRVLDYFSISF